MRIVIKLGTGVLTHAEGRTLDLEQFKRLSSEFADLVAEGHSCILVSSGAVTAGLSALEAHRSPR